jgi:hypothetical protein
MTKIAIFSESEHKICFGHLGFRKRSIKTSYQHRRIFPCKPLKKLKIKFRTIRPKSSILGTTADIGAASDFTTRQQF